MIVSTTSRRFCRIRPDIQSQSSCLRNNLSTVSLPMGRTVGLKNTISKYRKSSSTLSSHQENFMSRSTRWISSSAASPAAATATAIPEKIPEPSIDDLKLIALSQGIPFIGFGFMDNAILIIAGDAIDVSLGIYLGISTLCAAAIGNIISDLCGIGLGTMIEDFCANTLKLPVPNISSAQRTLRSVRSASNLGMAIGMTIGCILGMFPLMLLDTTKVEQRKKKAHVEKLFEDVVEEAKTLVQAESTCLYLRVHIDPEKIKPGEQTLYADSDDEYFYPAVDGEYFYAKKYDLPSAPGSRSNDDDAKPAKYPSRFIPLGKGIISRAALTGEAWNIADLRKEPDFLPAIREHYGGKIPPHLKHMVVVPVVDGHGQAIAVIRAMNKKNPTSSSSSSSSLSSKQKEDVMNTNPSPEGFTDTDVQILKSLASHISVSLQSVFRDENKDEMRLRDTIRILKEHGLEGIMENDTKNAKATMRTHTRPSLFPVHG